MLYKRKPLVDQTIELILEQTPNTKPTVRQINAGMRESVMHLWSIGMKEIVLGNPDADYKKMGEYLEEQKKERKARKKPRSA